MVVSGAELGAWLGAFFWPFLRIGAMVAVAPVFGAQSVPLRARLGIALALTLLVSPMVTAIPAVDPLSPASLLIATREILIGLVIGFALRIVFAALVLAGQAVANSMGLGFASIIDPQNGVSVPVVGQLYLILATLLFLAVGGHLKLIEVTAQSFAALPVGTALPPEALTAVAGWGTMVFQGGLLIALPILTAILLVNLSFGVITRSAPQLNIFAVGFPLTMLLGFLLLWLTLPTIVPDFVALLEEGFAMLSRALGMGG